MITDHKLNYNFEYVFEFTVNIINFDSIEFGIINFNIIEYSRNGLCFDKFM